MSRELFIGKKFRKSTMAEIERALAIISEYEASGFTLTLRQIFYQFVARALIANLLSEYKRIGHIIRDARRAGLIDWDAIEDRTRGLNGWQSCRDPESAILEMAEGYVENPWHGQRYRPEIWIEKEALVGVIEPACRRWRLPSFPARGNGSDSELYLAGKRFARYLAVGLIPLVLYFGDHDPTGLDAIRDVQERLSMFARADIEVRPLALTMEQIRRYGPPPNPAKETDSRYAAYVRQFGPECWELDALDPRVIDALIEAEMAALVDMDAWNSAMAQERANRGLLDTVAGRWRDIRDFLGNEEGEAP